MPLGWQCPSPSFRPAGEIRSHVDLVCRDLRRSLAFYRTVLGPLGLAEPALYPGERGEQIHYLRFPRPGSGSIGLRQASEEQRFLLYAPGRHHLALTVDSREDVDAATVAAGAHILHPPRTWPDYPNPMGSRRTTTPPSSSIRTASASIASARHADA